MEDGSPFCGRLGRGGARELRRDTTCLAYACNSSARMSATVPWPAASGEFELRLCHGDDCRDKIVTWDGVDPRCESDIETGGSSACVEPAEDGLRFDAYWTFGEGAPSEKTFRLRVIDRTSGAVMLDES